MWLSRVKHRDRAAFVWFELECTGWWSAWELPAHQISASNSNSFDLNLRPTPKTRMLSRVKIPKITTVTFFRKRLFVGVLSLCRPFLILLLLFSSFMYIFIFLCLELFRFYFGKQIFQCFFPSPKSGCWAGLTSKRFISSSPPQDIHIFNPAQPHVLLASYIGCHRMYRLLHSLLMMSV